MDAERAETPMSWRVYGLGVMGLGIASLVFGDFDPGQPVPTPFPARTALVYSAASLMLIGAICLQWRRTLLFGAAVLTFYYGLIVTLLMNGHLLLTGYKSYGTYEEISMQLALAVSASLVLTSSARTDLLISSATAASWTRLNQRVFAICSLIWGGAHFVYMSMTAPLVPEWLPPSQVFWGYFTGMCFIFAGLAILAGVQARLATILLTIMIASFGLFANGRMLITEPRSRWNWTESILNLALIGSAWVLAGSLEPRR